MNLILPDAPPVSSPSIRGFIATSPAELARAARAYVHSHGVVPFGFLRPEIEQSWRRSLRAGVEYQTPLHHMPADTDNAAGVLDENELLIRCAQPELDNLATHFGARAQIILCSADARILEVRGSKGLPVAGLDDSLRPGVAWGEGLFGTNALGTGIVERKTIHIHPGEHYLESLAPFSCTSSPVFDARGALVGVLDMTRLGRHAQPMDVMGLIQFAVRNIENRLFLRQFARNSVLAFHSRQHYLRSAWQGMLALDDSGRIIGINQPGCDLLGRSRDSLLDSDAALLFECSLNTLFAQALQGIGHRRTPAGKLYFELLHTAPVGLSARSNSVAAVATASAPTAAPAQDPRLQRALAMSLRAIERNIPVLLQGETGTGKEVAARHLHDHSQRQGKPFIAVNCAAIPESLMESELFGYRDGAFTGARKGGMSGRFQQANGGTLFLDEIGDMPPALQARLLRVLQERRVQPLGGGDDVELDIQLIAATHRDLKKHVAEGSFREDLYYRLNGVSVTLPALRERDDFPRLLNDLMARHGRPDVVVEAGLLKKLRAYHWPGNVRQLQMVLQVALAFMDEQESELGEEHLTDDFLRELGRPEPKSGLLQENELVLIRQALDEHDGNVSAAASALGISRATLYRRMREL